MEGKAHKFFSKTKRKVLKAHSFGLLIVALFIAFSGALIFTSFNGTSAASTDYINFQGKLTDANSFGLINQTRSITFCIFSASSGGSCSATPSGQLWYETKSVTTDARGIFSAQLGSNTSFGTLFTTYSNNDLYLAINVAGDGEMTPRHPIGNVPRAVNSDRLQGYQASDFAPASGSGNYVQLQGSTPGTQQTGHMNISGTGIFGSLTANTLLLNNGGSAGSPALRLNGDTDSGIFAASDVLGFSTAGTQRVYIDGTGNVSIGNITPTGRLHSYISNAAVTASQYTGYFENLATNSTTDSIYKYGLYVTSTGTFTGGSGGITENFGLYVNTPTGADSNTAAYFGGNVRIVSTAASPVLYITSSVDGVLRLARNSSGSPWNYMEWYNNTNRQWWTGMESGTGNFTIGKDNAAGHVYISGSNLGIGDASPASLLTVGNGDLFQVDSNGDMVKIKNLTYSWPSSHVTNGFLTNNGSGTLTWTTTVPATSVPWSSITNPAGNLALTMAAYTSTFTYNATTSTNNLFNLTDTASNTGTGYLLNVTTATGSTLKPFHVSAAGTEAITVLADGNVGIGLTSPGRNLDVSTAIRITRSGSYPFQEYVRSDNAGAVRFAERDYYARDASNNLDIFATEKFDITTATHGSEESKITWQTFAAGSIADRLVLIGSNLGVGTGAPTSRLHSYISNSAVTTSQYTGYFENLATNSTTDAINKYGLYITSTGTFTGSTGTATNNYGLYVNTPTGGDNNYAAYFGGNVTVAGTITGTVDGITKNISTGRNVTPWDQTFEENITGWGNINNSTVSKDNSQQYEGSYSMKMIRNDLTGAGGTYYTIGTGLKAGRTYTLSGYYKTANGTNSFGGRLNFDAVNAYTTGTAQQTVTFAGKTNWTYFSFSLTAVTTQGGNNNFVWIGYGVPDTTQSVHFDNLVLVEGSIPMIEYQNAKTSIDGLYSYYGGNVGIGVAAPTGRLHLPAGTATAGTAPLKFTAGTNLTAAEAGAMEWDGTNLYITQTTGPTRKTIAYTDSFSGSYLVTGNSTQLGYFNDIYLDDSDASHHLILNYSSNVAADYTLSLAATASYTLTVAGTASVSGTNTGDQTITLTGDVTGTGTGSFATTIADNSVDGTDIALGSDATGDIMYYNGTDYVRLAGSAGFLKSTGAAAPTWSTLTDTDVPDTITLTNITQITNRDHGSLTGLTDDDHSIYALLAGRAGGQTLTGGTAATDDLIFKTTSGTGASGADMIFTTGTNGGTTAMTIAYDGNITVGANKNLTLSGAGKAYLPKIAIERVSNVASGISWYNSASYSSWSEYMGPAGTASQGPSGTVTAPSGTYVTSWALRSFIESNANYGWTWESGASNTTTPAIVAELSSNNGNFKTTGGVYATGLTSTSLTAGGLVKAASSTGTLSIATAGTDYIAGGTGSNTQIAYFTNTGTLAGSSANKWLEANQVHQLGANGYTALQGATTANNNYSRGFLGAGVYWDEANNRYALTNPTYDRSAIQFINSGGIAFYAESRNDADSYMSMAEFNAIERMRLTPTGYLGIANTNPDVDLVLGSTASVNNVIAKFTGQDDAALQLLADTNDTGEEDNAYIFLSQDNGANTGVMGLAGNDGYDPRAVASTGALANAAYFGAYGSSALQLATNANVRMTVDSTGNIGIGETAPGAKLQVNTKADATIGLIVKANSATQSAHLQEWQDSSGNIISHVDEKGVIQTGGTTFGGGVIVNPSTLGYPTNLSVTPTGGTGSTSYQYGVSALSASGGETEAIASSTITNGVATLSGSTYNAISWTAVSNAVGYKIYRIVSGGTPPSLGYIGTTTNTSFNDTGLGATLVTGQPWTQAGYGYNRLNTTSYLGGTGNLYINYTSNYSPSNINAATSAATIAQSAMVLYDGTTNANTNGETLFDSAANGRVKVAQKFTASTSGLHYYMSLILSSTATLTNQKDYITVQVYTDSAGVPSSTTVGSATTMYYGALSTTPHTYQFRPIATLTSGTAYWIVITQSADPVGGDIVAQRGATGTALYAYYDTSWHTENSKNLWFEFQYSTMYGLHVTSETNAGVRSESASGVAFWGISQTGNAATLSTNSGTGIYTTSIFGLGADFISKYAGALRARQYTGLISPITAASTDDLALLSRDIGLSTGIDYTGAILSVEDKSTSTGNLIEAAKHTEIITNTVDRDFSGTPNWTGTNWSLSSAKWLHTSGSTTDTTLTSSYTSPDVVNSSVYRVYFTVSGRTAGSVTAKIGTAAGTARSADGTYIQDITAVADNASIIFTPTTDFNGSIDDIKVQVAATTFKITSTGLIDLNNVQVDPSLQYWRQLVFTGINGRIRSNGGTSSNDYLDIGYGGGFTFYGNDAETTDYTMLTITNGETSSTASITKTGLSISSTGTWNGTGAVNRGLYVTATGGTNNYAAIFDQGYVGIGSTSPVSYLDISGSQLSDSSLQYQQVIRSTAAYNASPVAGINFYNKYTSGGGYAGMGGIAVAKENTTDSNYASYLSLHTRPSEGNITERLRIASTGNVSIGTTYTPENLVVNSTGDTRLIINSNSADSYSVLMWARSSTASNVNNRQWSFSNTGNALGDELRVYDAGGTRRAYLTQNTNGWQTPSDIRIKENIGPIENALEGILDLRGVKYNLISKPGTREIGVIAQEFYKYFPEVVDTSNDNWGVAYDRLAPILVEAIKEEHQIVQGQGYALGTLETTVTSMDEAYKNLDTDVFTSAQILDVGDIVSLKPDASKEIVKSEVDNDQRVVGIVKEVREDGTYRVLMEGRAKLKVSVTKGEILSGDILTTSKDTPGVAVKSSDGSGGVLGVALQTAVEDGEIEVLLRTSYSPNSSGMGLLTAGQSAVLAMFSLESDGKLVVNSDFEVKGALKLGQNSKGYDISVSEGGKYFDVLFILPRETDKYAVNVTPNWLTSVAVTQKAKDHFRVEFANNAPANAKIDWVIIE